jgi:hypothetical protein
MIDIEHDERKIIEIRKHWYVMVKESVILILLLFLPIALYVIIQISPIAFITPGNENIMFMFLYTAWIFVFWAIFFFLWTEYYLDVWIITDQKMIDVDQISLFKREISTLQLDKIQDVTMEVHGMIPTVLHFGSLHVQTAGDQREFVIHDIAKPQLVKDVISSAIEDYNRNHFGGYSKN